MTSAINAAFRKARDGSEANFYEVIGGTTYGNEYELEFARELVVYENIGRGPATDLLAISLSPNDILGHRVGPDSPEMAQMALDLDHELADFFNFLGRQIGLADVWIALSADHGVSSLPDAVKKLRIPAANLGAAKLEEQINSAITARFFPGHPAAYVKLDYPVAWLDQDAFLAAHVRQVLPALHGRAGLLGFPGLLRCPLTAGSRREGRRPEHGGYQQPEVGEPLDVGVAPERVDSASAEKCHGSHVVAPGGQQSRRFRPVGVRRGDRPVGREADNQGGRAGVGVT